MRKGFFMSNELLKEKAFQQLRSAIVANRLKPGQSLVVRELSEELKISKTPIREAIQLLYKEGFVQIIPQKGCLVSPVTLSDIWEIMQIRKALEPVAAAEAALKADAETIHAFEEEFEAIARDPDREVRLMSEAGTRFHRFLIKSTRNYRLIEILNNLNVHMDRIRAIFVVRQSLAYHDRALGEHQRIMQAVKNRNAEKADTLMKLHIQSYWDVLKALA